MTLNSRQISSLLDTTIELEGLLTILANPKPHHTDVVTQEVCALVEEKISRLKHQLETPVETDAVTTAADVDDILEVQTVDDNEIRFASLCEPEEASTPAPRSGSSSTDEFADPDVDLNELSRSSIENAFSVDAKYRFRRELFANSDAEFSDALDVIGAMDSLQEAEDYFYNDLCWNPENPDVVDFMFILRKYFTQR